MGPSGSKWVQGGGFVSKSTATYYRCMRRCPCDLHRNGFVSKSTQQRCKKLKRRVAPNEEGKDEERKDDPDHEPDDDDSEPDDDDSEGGGGGKIIQSRMPLRSVFHATWSSKLFVGE